MMRSPSFAVLVLALLLPGCFPARSVTLEDDREVLESTHEVRTPAKAFLHDGSIVLFPKGFSVANSTTAMGAGRLYELGARTPIPIEAVPLDSIAAMTYYDLEHEGSSILGSFILSTYGPLITAYSVYCISCPKCCFGSCPTIYTGATDEQLEAELFSYSLSKFHQEHDLDRLYAPLPPDGRYRLRLTNEALETHYIDQLTLLTATHPPATEAFPTHDGRVVATQALQPPAAAFSARGRDVRAVLTERDENAYRTLSDSAAAPDADPLRDWIDLEVDIPEGADSLTLVFRLRNTLLSTILFYEVVLASQGIDALAWTERLNTDRAYADDYHALYNAFAGLTVSTRQNDSWVEQADIPDVGPIAWKDVAAVVPADASSEGRLQVRLSFFPDNLLIDYVAVGTAADNTVVVDEVAPSVVRDHAGREQPAVRTLLADDDEHFLITEAGDHFELVFETPEHETANTTVFARSNGYYLEWLRGDWLSPPGDGYRFDLYRLDETLTQLGRTWRTHRDELEARFFETRIPVRGR